MLQALVVSVCSFMFCLQISQWSMLTLRKFASICENSKPNVRVFVVYRPPRNDLDATVYLKLLIHCITCHLPWNRHFSCHTGGWRHLSSIYRPVTESCDQWQRHMRPTHSHGHPSATDYWLTIDQCPLLYTIYSVMFSRAEKIYTWSGMLCSSRFLRFNVFILRVKSESFFGIFFATLDDVSMTYVRLANFSLFNFNSHVIRCGACTCSTLVTWRVYYILTHPMWYLRHRHVRVGTLSIGSRVNEFWHHKIATFCCDLV